MAGGGGDLGKTRVLSDVEREDKEAEVILRIHIWKAGNGGAARG